MSKGIAFLGSLILDKVYTVSLYPQVGALTPIHAIEKSVGGLAANDAIDVKKLCPSVPCYTVGRVGNDGDGEFVLDFIKSAGVDVSMVKRVDGEATAFTDVISIAGGQRTFFTYSGANAGFGYDDVPWDSLECDILHLGYFLLLDKIDAGDGEKILKEASRRGIKTSIDLVSEDSDRYSIVVPVLKYVDYLIVNELEAGALAGIKATNDNLVEIASKLLELGVRDRVIIHCPGKGVCVSREGATELPSYKLPDGFIKGTAGAGDAFCSGALLGLLEGKGDREILEYAQLAAISSLRSVDCTSAVESIETLRKSFGDLRRIGE